MPPERPFYDYAAELKRRSIFDAHGASLGSVHTLFVAAVVWAIL